MREANDAVSPLVAHSASSRWNTSLILWFVPDSERIVKTANWLLCIWRRNVWRHVYSSLEITYTTEIANAMSWWFVHCDPSFSHAVSCTSTLTYSGWIIVRFLKRLLLSGNDKNRIHFVPSRTKRARLSGVNGMGAISVFSNTAQKRILMTRNG